MPCHSPSSIEALTRQFYEWEVRGRGWQVWDRPVFLEPPFRPFFGHFIPGPPESAVDDGRKSTFLSSLFDRLNQSGSGPSAPDSPEDQEPPPAYLEDEAPLLEIQIALPPETKITKDAAGQFLLSIGHVSRPVAFEIIGTSDVIVVQMACTRADRRQVREQLQAYFPDVILSEREGYVRALWDGNGGRATVAVDFGLSKEFVRPLRSYERFEPDPLAGVMGGMADLSPDEVALFQVLFSPVRSPWSESVMRAVTDAEGDSFFVDDPSMVKLAEQKISSPLFAAVIRVAAQSPREKRAWHIARGIGKSLRQFADAASNEFIPLANDEYDDGQHAGDVVTRRSCRSGMILNCDELLSLAHLPSASARSEKLKREGRRTKAAPALAFGHALVLGDNHHAGKSARVTMGPEQRVRHMHLIGASGSGKSTLLLNLIVQDIHSGEGLAVLDPHGDLIDQVLGYIPQERINDVVLVDPSDEAYPIGFNILSAHSELERNLLASDLVSVFRRLSTSFGDQMNTVLANAIMAFLESGEGGTLSDLRRFLVERELRERFLETVRDPEIVYYWQKEFPLLAGKPQGPILTRLDTFLRPKVIRHMVSQKANRIDCAAIMNGRKILLVKLAQGLIGEENSYLLGTFIVSKLNQMAMSRQSMAAAERKPFYLYVDEFHNFVTPSLAAILAGARKYNLGLILAHQELHQLSSRDTDVASAVISNPYTRVCFRLGDSDAKKLEDGFAFFRAKDLQNLAVGEAICRIERAEYDFNLKVTPVPAVEPELSTRRREQVVAASRTQYATAREDVESLLRSGRVPRDEAPAPAAKKPVKMRLSVPLPEGKATSEPTRDMAPVAGTPGRGGERHKYLQQLIQRWAEGRGYEVALEKPVLDGLGIIDVVLTKPGRSPIACEISVTTSPEHELQNAQKCFAAGYDHVFLVAPDKEVLARVRARAVAVLNPGEMKKIQFVLPEQVFASVSVLESRAAPPSPTPTASEELLTAKEVEELLRIDVKTIYSYVQRGMMPYIRIQSNLRFVKADVLAWVAEHRSGGMPSTRK
jgi:predicted DNA-binding transcriptional regulator AlpA